MNVCVYVRTAALPCRAREWWNDVTAAAEKIVPENADIHTMQGSKLPF